MGLTGYYRKFIKNYGLISRPLTDLRKKNVQFTWTTTTDEAFRTLKHQLITAPVLAVPDFSKQFVVETDASDLGIGAVLMQEQHPIAYFSKALGPRNQALSVYEKNVWLYCLQLINGDPIFNISPSSSGQIIRVCSTLLNKDWQLNCNRKQ